ncbi:MAG: NUDIX domain-containing protein [Candidatus Saccharimonadales bacterium]
MSEQQVHSESIPVVVAGSDELRDLLELHDVDTSSWGQGPTKTVDGLYKEIADGESIIVEEDGELIRGTTVVGVDVIARLVDGSSYRLREDKQVFKNDGSERHRHLDTSLGEKMKPDETTEQAVRRAILEELGIKDIRAITEGEVRQVDQVSQAFDGLRSRHEIRRSEVIIGEASFAPQGYVERQPDKDIYFVWDKLPITIGV